MEIERERERERKSRESPEKRAEAKGSDRVATGGKEDKTRHAKCEGASGGREMARQVKRGGK